MSEDEFTTATSLSPWADEDGGEGEQLLGLVIAWSRDGVDRLGEVALVPEDSEWSVLGRGERGEQKGPRITFHRQRPGSLERRPALRCRGLSRDQARVRSLGDSLEVECIGKCRAYVDGEPVERASLLPGQTLRFEHELLLLCVPRPLRMPHVVSLPADAVGPFGVADPNQIVGESAAVWRLRERLARSAATDGHVLLLGESGTGKELAARALHALSKRARKTMVARNAATFPEGLMDAELFGNVKDYPNPGMPDRAGLLGESDGSTLFLDEIGELSTALQAHLLRALDDGEYQRLGEARARRANLRLVAATNRSPDALKHDLRARLSQTLELPDMDQRREDVPLLAHHLLRRMAAGTPDLSARFFDEAGEGPSAARVSPVLMDLLVRHRFQTHLRELEALLWKAIHSSEGSFLDATAEVRDAVQPLEHPKATTEPSADEIRACLQRHDGNQNRAWRDLGLRNRFVLYRLIKKHGIDVA